MTQYRDDRSILRTTGFALALILCVVTPTATHGAEPTFFDSHGVDPVRGSVNELPFEHIDPLTGNLMLTFTDLALPGDGGLGLTIQRTYNSKVYRQLIPTGGGELGEESWAGFGWILHMGRVINPNSTTPGPVIEMPDGSQHELFLHPDASSFPSNTNHFQSRDFWTYDKGAIGGPKLRLPNGLVYTFSPLDVVIAPYTFRYVTRIDDPFGNYLVVTYSQSAPDTIDEVRQVMRGGDERRVRFRCGTNPLACTDQNRNLSKMELLQGGPPNETLSWTYTQSPMGQINYTQLTQVGLPEGPPWQFGYYTTADAVWYVMRSVTTPSGGLVTYIHAPHQFMLGSISTWSPAVTKRTVTGHPTALGGGTLDFFYDSTLTYNQTTVQASCSPLYQTVYRFSGVDFEEEDFAWKIGALEWRKRQTNGGAVVWEKETFLWTPSVRISAYNIIPTSPYYIRAPLLQDRIIERTGQGTYSTHYTYNDTVVWNDVGSNGASQFNDYGRPEYVDETGDDLPTFKRRTFQHFFYSTVPLNTYPGFSNYIVDKTSLQTVTSPFPGGVTYENEYFYDTDGGYKGFLETQIIRGIRTDFTPEINGSGNIKTSKDGNNNTTTFTYDWGVQKTIQTPEYTINRVIDPDGTIASETRGGFTTSFDYDKLFRLRVRTPPSPTGNPSVTSLPTFIDYDLDGEWVKTTRGSVPDQTFTQTFNDGFGRPYKTINSQDEQTKKKYDACGRVSYESYPFKGGPESEKGENIEYDRLDRPIKRVRVGFEGGTPVIRYEYTGATAANGIDVDIYDEMNHRTFQDWSAFGDPRDARLMSVTAFGSQSSETNTTSYTYNGLGSIATMTPQEATSLDREWTYYTTQSGGAPGLLRTEDHPENGTVTYTYDDAGNVATRQDAEHSSPTRYCYDGNNRLIAIRFPGNPSSTCDGGGFDREFNYDAYDNKTHDIAPDFTSVFVYDGANRLRTRTDTFVGESTVLTTAYLPDSKDNLLEITYPGSPQHKARYDYDRENRVVSVGTGNGGNDDHYASDGLYHPSGALKSYSWGNGRSTTMVYDPNRYWITSIKSDPQGLPSIIDLEYDNYDGVGNVGLIRDENYYDQTFLYDGLDRLTDATRQSSPNLTWKYTYTKRGDRLTKKLTQGTSTTVTYDYDDTGTNPTARLMSASDGVSTTDFDYDANGNTTALEVAGNPLFTFTYTPENLMSSVTQPGPPPITTSYTYDGAGLRKRKITQSNGVERRQYFVHGPQNQLLSEFVRRCDQSSLAKARDYLYFGQRLLAEIDSTALPEVSFQIAATTVEEDAGTVVVSVRMITWDGCPLDTGVSVAYATANGTATSGQPPNGDYVAASGTLNFPAGTASGASQNITVAITNDALVEPNQTCTPGQCFETFTINLSNPVGATVPPAGATHTVSILDDDGVVAFQFATTTVDEYQGTAVAMVILKTQNNLPLSNQVIVSYETADGTAQAGSDYEYKAGTVTFNIGETTGATRPISVDLLDDHQSECDDEYFHLVITDVQGGAPGSPAVHVFTIRDDDYATINIDPAVSTYEGDGGTSGLGISVNLSQSSCKTVTVQYATLDGTAVSSGPHPDYIPSSGTLTFNYPAILAVAPVSIVGDTVHEETNQTFSMGLSNPINGIPGQMWSTITIVDNDAAPSLAIAVTPGTPPIVPEGDEGTNPASFTVSMSGNLSEPGSFVDYSTADGTASAAQPDYVSTAGTLAFPPFSTGAQTVIVPVVGDSIDEPQENYFVNLTNPVHATISVPQVTGTIADDDPPAMSSTELFHGIDLEESLTGAAPIQWYRIGQKPYASYEILTDSTVPGAGVVDIVRVDENLAVIPPNAQLVSSIGTSRSLRWMNWSDVGPSVPITKHSIKVYRIGCFPCPRGPFRLRAYETTYSFARFNNVGAQATTLTIQNNGRETVSGHIHFWSASGSLLASLLLGPPPANSLAPKQAYTFDTSSIPALAEAAGSITISNNGRYGVLSGTAVATDGPFVFETFLEARKLRP